MMIEAFHLPADIAGRARVTVAERDGVTVVAPVLDRGAVDMLCTRLIDARHHIMEWPVERIIAAIDAAAALLRDPGNAERSVTLRALVAITGYSAAMASHVLDRMTEDWTSHSLRALIASEFGDVTHVTRPVRLLSPALGMHVFSGNVPGVNVTSIVRSLLVRTAVLGKSASQEPVLAAAFARLLAQLEPLLGACVAVTWWQGGNIELEDAALERAGIVVHYGSADAIASLAARAPAHTRLVEHGPRISFAVVDESATSNDIARDLALAVATFDQHGCVSPQVAYVIGSVARARAFADDVARELGRVEQRLPRGRIDAGEASAIRALRTRFEFTNGGTWFGDDALRATVLFADDIAFEGSCLNRTLLVKRAASLEDVVAAVQPFGRALQTVGVAGIATAGAARFVDVGATRISTISGMPWPPPTWHHDGRGPLRELVSLADVEV